jgi:predicted metal-dependent enzyme (double-stranded beta helix superfamily)
VGSYSVEQYLADIRVIAAEEKTDAKIGERIKPLAASLAADPSWFKEDYRRTDAEQGFGVHLLHEEANHDLAVFVIAWAAGRGVGAHNHRTLGSCGWDRRPGT